MLNSFSAFAIIIPFFLVSGLTSLVFIFKRTHPVCVLISHPVYYLELFTNEKFKYWAYYTTYWYIVLLNLVSKLTFICKITGFYKPLWFFLRNRIQFVFIWSSFCTLEFHNSINYMERQWCSFKFTISLLQGVPYNLVYIFKNWIRSSMKECSFMVSKRGQLKG